MENGAPSRKFIGKDANYILAEAGVNVDFDVRVIILRTDKIHPFVVKEMLMPILPIVTVKDFDEGLATALQIENRRHHTATMHSQNVGRMNIAAKKFQTSIFVKNGLFRRLRFWRRRPSHLYNCHANRRMYDLGAGFC